MSHGGAEDMDIDIRPTKKFLRVTITTFYRVCLLGGNVPIFAHRQKIFIPQTMCLTLGVLTVREKRPGFRSEVPDRLRGNSRVFVLRCAFLVVILILLGWPRWA